MADTRTENGRERRRGTGFLGKGLLLALPVIVLSLFGILSLRQDRKILESEVRERAQAFANESVERCWQRLTTVKGTDSIPAPFARDTKIQAFTGLLRVSSNGDLLSPPPVLAVPSPSPSVLSTLTPEQAALWQRIEADRSTSPTNTGDNLRALLAARPPAEFEAKARFRLALLSMASDTKKASAEFHYIIDRFPDALGDTGIPLSTLATMQLADLSIAASDAKPEQIRSTLDGIASNAVARPTLLTPSILDRAAGWEELLLHSTNLIDRWKAAWAMDERHRSVYAAIARSLPPANETAGDASNRAWPEILWFHCDDALFRSGGEPELSTKNALWLAVCCQKGDDGARSYVYRDTHRRQALLSEFDEAEKALPDYLGVYYRISGTTFAGVRLKKLDPYYAASHKMGDPRDPAELSRAILPSQNVLRPVLASATHRSGDAKELCQVAVILLDPAKLYVRQRQRVWWFGGLIALSALVALAGFVSTWSAFQRQQRLYQMQTNFVSSVTHELRAPIGAVRLMAENLKRAKVPDPKEQQQVFDYIVQECARLSSMIENVLNLARIEQGRKEYEFEQTDIRRLVADTVQLMAPHAAACQIALEAPEGLAPFDDGGEAAVLDGRAIQQLLINLIDNAIKHSPAKSTVRIGLESIANAAGANFAGGSPAPRRLRLWVADRGPGIPPEERDKIFDRFYRLGSELRRETFGVGIGLSIVKHIVAAHRGAVWVEDEAGGGSRFTVELPWVRCQNKQA
jgi:signal transduction histidine kinase